MLSLPTLLSNIQLEKSSPEYVPDYFMITADDSPLLLACRFRLAILFGEITHDWEFDFHTSIGLVHHVYPEDNHADGQENIDDPTDDRNKPQNYINHPQNDGHRN